MFFVCTLFVQLSYWFDLANASKENSWWRKQKHIHKIITEKLLTKSNHEEGVPNKKRSTAVTPYFLSKLDFIKSVFSDFSRDQTI